VSAERSSVLALRVQGGDRTSPHRVPAQLRGAALHATAG
jgi:hypothetical protein